MPGANIAKQGTSLKMTRCRPDREMVLLGDRVTRLGEFSPIRPFTFGSVLKISTLAQILGYCFPRYQIMNFYKKWLDYILGDYFTNSSGHPARKVREREL
jgi:hypothetical protein